MANRTLILLRHAKSDWYSGASRDFDRPLNKRGLRDAPKVGRWLSKNGYQPGAIACSPAERASQTIDIVCESAGWNTGIVHYDDALYLASARTIRHIAESFLEDHEQIALVGHNPGLELALLDYCPEADASDDGKIMTTAALAVIEFRGGPGGDSARLVTLKRPAALDVG